MTFCYYPDAQCSTNTCRLTVGFASSDDGGRSWTPRRPLAGPMSLRDLANTAGGRMVGNYISTSFSGNNALGFFAVGKPSLRPAYDEAIYTRAVPMGDD